METTYDFTADRKRQKTPSKTIETAERLTDEIVAVLKNYDTETLVAIVDYYEPLWPNGWLTQLIRQHTD